MRKKYMVTREEEWNDRLLVYGDIIELDKEEFVNYPFNSSLELVEFIDQDSLVNIEIEEEEDEDEDVLDYVNDIELTELSKTILSLESMNMKQLREFVKEQGLNARDTSRVELIEEIKKELKIKGDL